MKKPAILAAAFAATLLATPARADDFPSAISVSGEATVSAAPDLAQIDAGVANDAKSAKEASDANNAAMGKVLLALWDTFRDNGISIPYPHREVILKDGAPRPPASTRPAVRGD